MLKKCGKKNKKLKIVLIICLCIVIVFCFLHFFVNPIIVKTNEATIKNTAVNVINSSISSTMLNKDYYDLIKIEKDENNEIQLIEVKTFEVNNLNNLIINLTQNNLNKVENINCKIPLGTFTGIPALNGLGKSVSLKILPIGNVATKFNSSLISAGINQTLHKISININVTFCVLLPLYSQEFTVNSSVLVAETVIVGKIPSVYFNSESLNNALNLVP